MEHWTLALHLLLTVKDVTMSYGPDPNFISKFNEGLFLDL